MEKDFHFYIIYALAKVSGFDRKVKGTEDNEAQIIAYASQYVDDNCEKNYLVPKGGESYQIRWQDRFDKSRAGYFYPLITQSVNIKSLNQKIQSYVFMPFHFLPGDYENAKINEVGNPYCTTRNSANANKLIDDALKNGGLCRIGAALHTYADTWAHERFTAFNEPWNKVIEWYKDFKALAPNIGHADMWHTPDQICKTWRDHRFKDEGLIINKDRAIEAAENIYGKLSKKRKGTPWSEIKKHIEKIIYLDSSVNDADEKMVYDERKRRIEEFVGEALDYDKDKWISEVLDFELEEAKKSHYNEPSMLGEEELIPVNIRLKEGFESSHWYKFQVAAKIHQSEALRLATAL